MVGGELVIFAANLVVASSGTALLKKTFFVHFMLYVPFCIRGFDALGSAFGFSVWQK